MSEGKNDKKRLCYDSLKERILTVEMPPDSLLDEGRLSKEYHLSRTPLREVLHRLDSEGYVTITANRGTHVSSMDLKTMRNFFQTAPLVYAAIARLASENATLLQIESLKKIQSHFRIATQKHVTRDMVIHNYAFHKKLGDMAASRYLEPSINRLLIDHVRMSQKFYTVCRKDNNDRVDIACEHHEAMIEAIEKRQAEVMVDLTLQHWDLSRNQIEEYVYPAAMPIDDIENHRKNLSDAI